MNYEKIDFKVLLIPASLTIITLLIMLIYNNFIASKIDSGWYYKIENKDKDCNQTVIYFYKEKAIFVVTKDDRKVYKRALLRSSIDYDKFKTKVLDVDDTYGRIFDTTYQLTLPNGFSKEVNGENKFINDYIALTGEKYSLSICDTID